MILLRYHRTTQTINPIVTKLHRTARAMSKGLAFFGSTFCLGARKRLPLEPSPYSMICHLLQDHRFAGLGTCIGLTTAPPKQYPSTSHPGSEPNRHPTAGTLRGQPGPDEPLPR